MQESINTKRYQDELDANCELAQWEALLVMAKNPHLAITIEISGLRMGICSNKKIIPVIKQNIAEIKEFLKGNANEWE